VLREYERADEERGRGVSANAADASTQASEELKGFDSRRRFGSTR
jgi:hypothetical protein